ncbi:capsid protein, partial [Clostridium perfringens]
IVFGEYASPSFDSVVETVGKAKTYGVMSIEQCMEEMYGDTWTDEEKEEEIQRIKKQNGYLVAEEPKTVDDYDMSYTDDNEVETDGQEG